VDLAVVAQWGVEWRKIDQAVDSEDRKASQTADLVREVGIQPHTMSHFISHHMNIAVITVHHMDCYSTAYLICHFMTGCGEYYSILNTIDQ
jgi:hypothetical protein